MNFDIWYALKYLADPATLLCMAFGGMFGTLMGAIPGLTGTLGIALLLPFTFGLDPTMALLLLASVYCGSEYGGAYPAILINTPGTGAAVCTTFDGYALAQQGKAQEALYLSNIVSLVGGFVGVIALIFLSIPLAYFSLKFGAPEQFWLAVFSLTIIASLSTGNMLKGLIGAILGLLLSTVGMDPVTGHNRFTFGSLGLSGGINVVAFIIGLFTIPQAFLLLGKEGGESVGEYNPRKGVFFPMCKEVLRRWVVTLEACVIGIIVGIMPGVGGNVATFIAYNEAKRISKKPEEFGKGSYDGLIAPEACNNAIVGGSLIPLLTLGIPGSAPAAVLSGALMIHGLQPGFKLFSENGNIVFTFMIGLFITNLIIVLLGTPFIRGFSKVLMVPRKFLVASILAMGVVGSYAIRNASIDVVVMGLAGIAGYFMIRFGYGVAPAALGMILGELTEEGFKLSLIIGSAKGSVWAYFFARPICIVLIVLTVLSLVFAFYSEMRAKKKKQNRNSVEEVSR